MWLSIRRPFRCLLTLPPDLQLYLCVLFLSQTQLLLLLIHKALRDAVPAFLRLLQQVPQADHERGRTGLEEARQVDLQELGVGELR